MIIVNTIFMHSGKSVIIGDYLGVNGMPNICQQIIVPMIFFPEGLPRRIPQQKAGGFS